MKKLLLVPLTAAAFVLAACSTEKPGTPSAAPSSPSQGGESTAPTTATGGADPASIDPCSLLGVTDLASYGTFKAPVPQNDAGARGCEFTKEAETAADAVSLGVDIRDKQGIDSVSDGGNGKTTGNVNGRKAVLVPKPPSGCLMALEIGASARADIVVVASDPEKSCGMAEKIADIVEPKLPKG
ncbi:DUF3558 domain-containing protein [Amycolatopsis japonica]|uniref:Conserved putative secreted protein n=1 Tax=Amycolatopsis japonica TaxID=208439 RepID=A0A075UJZ9_9PSEU|nr:DUF3558 domain-containing protein [Amycolatopsis japonica]AIG73188.1 Conserved putative secreted protein [Amycolatopsis japonica]